MFSKKRLLTCCVMSFVIHCHFGTSASGLFPPSATSSSSLAASASSFIPYTPIWGNMNDETCAQWVKRVKNVIKHNPYLKKVTRIGEQYVVRELSERDFSVPDEKGYQPLYIQLQLNGDVMIVGDLHGDIRSLLTCLCYYFVRSIIHRDTKMLFLGDYVDRGSDGYFVIMTLLYLTNKYPDNFFLLRGNHENGHMNERWGFAEELHTAHRDKTYDAIVDLWQALPLIAIVNAVAVCVHGGIPEHHEEMCNPNSSHEIENGVDTLWSDPGHLGQYANYLPNPRRSGKVFSAGALEQFLIMLNTGPYPEANTLIRAHECDMPPEFYFEGKLLTVFSSLHYPAWGTAETSAVCIVKRRRDGSVAKDIIRMCDLEPMYHGIFPWLAELLFDGEERKRVCTVSPLGRLNEILETFLEQVDENSLSRLNDEFHRTSQSEEGQTDIGYIIARVSVFFRFMEYIFNQITIFDNAPTKKKFDDKKEKYADVEGKEEKKQTDAEEAGTGGVEIIPIEEEAGTEGAEITPTEEEAGTGGAEITPMEEDADIRKEQTEKPITLSESLRDAQAKRAEEFERRGPSIVPPSSSASAAVEYGEEAPDAGINGSLFDEVLKPRKAELSEAEEEFHTSGFGSPL